MLECSSIYEEMVDLSEKRHDWGGDTAQRLRAFATFVEDLDSVSITQMLAYNHV